MGKAYGQEVRDTAEIPAHANFEPLEIWKFSNESIYLYNISPQLIFNGLYFNDTA